MKMLSIVLNLVVILYLVLCLVLLVMQRKLLYFPQPEASLSEFDSFKLTSKRSHDSAQLKIWTIPAVSDQEATGEHVLLYFGGNAEAVEHNLIPYQQHFGFAHQYLMNYRGFGGSDGSMGEAAVYHDALALYDEVAARHPGAQINVIGRSLGSGVATYLASQRDVSRLILVTAYDSIERIAAERFRLFPVRFLLKDRYQSVSRANKLNGKVLMLTASDDVIVSRASSERLAAAIPAEQLTHSVLDDTSHATIQAHADYYDRIGQFIRTD